MPQQSIRIARRTWGFVEPSKVTNWTGSTRAGGTALHPTKPEGLHRTLRGTGDPHRIAPQEPRPSAHGSLHSRQAAPCSRPAPARVSLHTGPTDSVRPQRSCAVSVERYHRHNPQELTRRPLAATTDSSPVLPTRWIHQVCRIHSPRELRGDRIGATWGSDSTRQTLVTGLPTGTNHPGSSSTVLERARRQSCTHLSTFQETLSH
jgi:hypothetical protein